VRCVLCSSHSRLLSSRSYAAVHRAQRSAGGERIQVGSVEVKCEFCQTLVQFSRDDLAQLLV